MNDHERVRALIRSFREQSEWRTEHQAGEAFARELIADAAALERVLADAERYQWLRKPYDRAIPSSERAWAKLIEHSVHGERFDAIVDAARASEA